MWFKGNRDADARRQRLASSGRQPFRRLSVEALEHRRVLANMPMALDFATDVDGAIEQAEEVDCYSFQASEGEIYNLFVDVSGGTLLGKRIQIRNEAGIATNSYHFTEPTSGFTSWTAPTDGTFFIEVRGSTPIQLGTYTFSLDVVVDDHGDDINNATVVDVPGDLQGRIDHSQDSDFFSLAPTPGTLYQISTTDDLSRGPRLHLHEQEGPVRSSITGLDEFQVDGTAYWLAADAGPYIVEISSGFGLGDYEFTIQAVENTFDDDHGNLPAEATPLIPGTVVDGSTDFETDVDVFSFDATAGELFRLAVRTDSYNVGRVNIADENQPLFDFRSIETFQDYDLPTWVAPADGVFYLRVTASSYEPDISAYTVEVTRIENDDDHGNIADQATPLENGATVDGILTADGDVDVFSFQAVAGVDYNIQLDEFFQGSVMILDTDGTTGIGDFFFESNITWTATGTGEFFIALSEFFSSDDMPYTLSVNSSVDDYSGSIENATELALPASISGRLDTVTDQDTFSLFVEAGSIYRFSLSSYEDPDLHSVSVSLLDSDENYLHTFDQTDGESRLFTESGTYFLRVSGFDNLSDYTLHVEQIEYADDHANMAIGSTALTVAAPTAGEIEVEGDVDFFQFTASGGVAYTATITSNRHELRLIDGSTGEELQYTEAPSLSWQPASDGLFYIAVSRHEGIGSYEIDIDGPFDDHGNSETTATPISVGEIASGESNFIGDEDFFSFEATVGELFAFNVKGANLVFLGTDGDRVSLVSSERYVAATTGTHFLKINNINEPFSLLVSELTYDDDHGNGYDNATTIPLPASMDAAIELAGDADWFSFSAVEGTTYDFRTSSSPWFDAGQVLRVYNQQPGEPPQELAFSERAELSWTATSDGVFFVEVTGRSAGPYEFSAQARDDDYANTMATAVPIEFPTDLSGNIQYQDDIDAFSFTLNADTTYEFLTTTASGDEDDIFLTLLDSNGNGFTFGTARAWTAPADGTYFALISGGYKFFDEYSLQIRELPTDEDHGNDIGSATAINVNSTTSGVLENVNDRDVFSFSASAGNTYFVEMLAGSLPSTPLEFFTADGTQLFPERADLAPYRVTATSDGDIFVRIASTFDTIGSYEIAIELPVDDHGDTPDTATPFALLDSVSGRFDGDGDVDYFSFPVTAGTRYLFEGSFNNPFQILGTDGTTDAANPFQGPWVANEDGTYFVSAFGETGVEYDFQISEVPTDDDHGDTATGATTLTDPSGLMVGRLDGPNDEDVFAFDAVAGTNYEFDVLLASSSSTFARLIGPDGVTELQSAFAANWVAPETATYYYRVTGNGTGTYVFEFSSSGDDHQNSADLATPIDVPIALEGELEFPTDVDFFAFDAEEGVVYDISSSIGRARLFDTDGITELDLYRDATLTNRLWGAPTTGTYFVRVDHFASTDYTLTVNTVDYEDDYGNTLSDATPVSLPLDIESSLEIAGDVDFLSFSASARTSYVINLLLNESELIIYGPDGTETLRMFGNSSTVWVPNATATYTVEVTDRRSRFPGFAPYTLTIDVPQADDHSDLERFATRIELPSDLEGTIGTPDDRDLFRFDVTAGVEYTASISGFNFRGELTGRDRNGSVNSTLSFSGTRTWTPETSGSFILDVFSNNGTGDYRLNVSAVMDDFPDIHPVSGGDVIEGRIETPNESDVFTFTPQPGLAYDIRLTPTVPPEGEPTLGFLVRQDFGVPFVPWVPESNRPVSVTVFSSVIESYTLEIVEIPTNTDDHGNDIENATDISVGTSLTGSFEFNTDRDVFRFEAVAGAVYNAAVASTDDIRHPFVMRILGPDGQLLQELEPFTVFPDDGTQIADWTAPSDGAYFIEIHTRSDHRAGDYQFDLTQRVAVPITNLLYDEPLAPSRIELFSFEADAGDVFVLDVRDRYGLISAELLDRDASTVLISRVGPNPTTEWTAQASGTYFLRFDAITEGSQDLDFEFQFRRRLECDYVGNDNGCDIYDLDALYAGMGRAPTREAPASLDLMIDWLDQASSADNYAKQNPSDVYQFGDLNLNGRVDAIDLGLLLNRFNSEQPSWRHGDLNADGFVDSQDIGLLLNNFDSNTVVAAASEEEADDENA